MHRIPQSSTRHHIVADLGQRQVDWVGGVCIGSRPKVGVKARAGSRLRRQHRGRGTRAAVPRFALTLRKHPRALGARSCWEGRCFTVGVALAGRLGGADALWTGQRPRRHGRYCLGAEEPECEPGRADRRRDLWNVAWSTCVRLHCFAQFACRGRCPFPHSDGRENDHGSDPKALRGNGHLQT